MHMYEEACVEKRGGVSVPQPQQLFLILLAAVTHGTMKEIIKMTKLLMELCS